VSTRRTQTLYGSLEAWQRRWYARFSHRGRQIRKKLSIDLQVAEEMLAGRNARHHPLAEVALLVKQGQYERKDEKCDS
jgi:hypothetical protein